MADCPGISLRGAFWNFGYLGESRESPILEFGIPRTVFGDSLENTNYNVLKMDLLTSMPINEKLPDALKRHYTLVYHEDHLPRSGYLCFKKGLWGIQAKKCIIKKCLDWRFLDIMRRSDIFTTRFWEFFSKKTMCLSVVNFLASKVLFEGRGISKNPSIVFRRPVEGNLGGVFGEVARPPLPVGGNVSAIQILPGGILLL